MKSKFKLPHFIATILVGIFFLSCSNASTEINTNTISKNAKVINLQAVAPYQPQLIIRNNSTRHDINISLICAQPQYSTNPDIRMFDKAPNGVFGTVAKKLTATSPPNEAIYLNYENSTPLSFKPDLWRVTKYNGTTPYPVTYSAPADVQSNCGTAYWAGLWIYASGPNSNGVSDFTNPTYDRRFIGDATLGAFNNVINSTNPTVINNFGIPNTYITSGTGSVQSKATWSTLPNGDSLLSIENL
ncbi:MAG: hypothetical protein H7239_14860 [Flavobacterium sp.]|nr:hypothetical protein [Flavobacterium sp.]